MNPSEMGQPSLHAAAAPTGVSCYIWLLYNGNDLVRAIAS